MYRFMFFGVGLMISATVSATTWILKCEIAANRKSVLITNNSGRYLPEFQSWTLMMHNSDGELLLKAANLSHKEALPQDQSYVYNYPNIPDSAATCELSYETPSWGP